MIDSKFVIFNKKSDTDGFEKNALVYVCGQTGTGKSTILLNIMKHIQSKIRTFEEAYFFTGSKKDVILKNLGRDAKVSHDPEVFDQLMTDIFAEPKSPRRLIILDDLIADPMFRLNQSKKFLKFVLNHRHNNVTIVITSQGFQQLNKQIRSQASLLFCFPSRNELQAEDMEKQLPVSKEKLKQAMDIAKARGDHTFLYLNLQQAKPRFFIGFNEILDL